MTTPASRWRRFSAVAVVIATALIAPGASAAEDATDPFLTRGIREVESGQDLVATDTLESAVRRLFREPDAQADLARAYLYLGVAWARLERSERATGNFAEALAIDWGIEPPKALRDPRVNAAFEAARKETRDSGRAPASAAKKGGLGALGIAGIAGGAAGIAAITAATARDPVPFVRVTVSILEVDAGGNCTAAQRYVGLISKSPPGVDFPRGAEVLLRAGPASYTTFETWGGGCAAFGANPVCTVLVEADTLVTGCFRAND